MRFPTSKVSEILSRDSGLEGAIKQSFEHFRPWIENSTPPPFFPEYTDHGWNHICEVTISASGLISDESWEVFTPRDAAVLYLAILLHDSAMHLSEHGFLELIQSTDTGIEHGDEPWEKVWSDFMISAKKFDGKKLNGLFGSLKPIDDIPCDPDEFTKRDRMLIGEFIRINHPRIAQEVAHRPVPSGTCTKKNLLPYWSDNCDILQMAGLIARSHGYPIRKYFTNLDLKFNLREHRDTHPVFLMVILRIADYLQLHRDRAPGQVLSIKKFSSPVSLGEWNIHQSITDIRNTHDDPEAIYLEVVPKSATAFLKTKTLISGLQQELDSCWAVLGEVFGRINGLNKMGIVIRRVRSSLELIDEDNNDYTFIPKSASFQSTDSDLLKLLVEPLYGNKPEVGVRELLQNSLDAVRERIRIENPENDISKNETHENDYKIVISLTKDADDINHFVLVDQGTGMTPDTIINYFLRAGASFRRSDDWRENFENEAGDSQVLRAGRFGIGVLAAFLIGPEIEVCSRHLNSTFGVKFTASVEDDNIELVKIECDVGTRISVRVTTQAAKSLRLYREYWNEKLGDSWDWYCHQNPEVVRFIDEEKLQQKYILPKLIDSENHEWKKIHHHDFTEVLWTYEEKYPKIVCNGVLIKQENNRRDHLTFPSNGFLIPNLSILDPNGLLPLNLQRDTLTTNDYPFEKELFNSVVDDFIQYSINIKSKFITGITPKLFNEDFIYLGSRRSHARQKQSLDWYMTKEGFGYMHRDLINSRGFTAVNFLCPSSPNDHVEMELCENECSIVSIIDNTLSTYEQILRNIYDYRTGQYINNSTIGYNQFSELGRIKWSGVCICISLWGYNKFFRDAKLPNYIRSTATLHGTMEHGSIISFGKIPIGVIERWKEVLTNDNTKLSERSIVGQFYRDNTEDLPIVESTVALRWLELIGNREIPFANNHSIEQL